eukprot:scaffold1690_cov182-Amphora_coffeaeformis.AAC.79
MTEESNRCIEEEAIRQKWTQEQLELARRVHIPDDGDWTDDQVVAVSNQDKFCLVSLDDTTAASNTHNNTNTLYGGVDVSFPKQDETDPSSVAVYVIIDTRTMEVVYEDYEYFRLTVPYIPTFLAFREIDPLQRLIERQLEQQPRLRPRAILVDGNGVLHPRGAGIACFVGVNTGIPTIGIGKTLYCMGGLSHSLVESGVHRALRRAAAALPCLSDGGVVASSSQSNNINNNNNNNSYQHVLFDQQVLFQARDDSEYETEKEANANEIIDPGAHLETLAWYHCRGLAIPLGVPTQDRGDDDDDDEDIVLGVPNAGSRITVGYALVGHGDGHVPKQPRQRSRRRLRRGGGTKNPIFVSVGHGVSLRRAVEVTAALSLTRIPEPIRQADLRGRNLMRRRAAGASARSSTATTNTTKT